MIEEIDGLESVRESGQQVIIEFARRAPALPQRPMRLTYRSREQGARREILGIPAYTHSTALPFGGWLHHYRVTNLESNATTALL